VADFCEDVEEASNEINFVQRTLFRLHIITVVQSIYNKASACEHEYVEVSYLQTQNTFTHDITKVVLSFRTQCRQLTSQKQL